MATVHQLLGDVPLEILLKENPCHALQDWVIESYLGGETLRTKHKAAAAIRFIDCGIMHAFHPEGPQSEQQCPYRPLNAVCFHGEQWESGLGIIRQFAEAAAALNLATKAEIGVLTGAQDVFGTADMVAHRDAPGVREGRYSLVAVQERASCTQHEHGLDILRVRDLIAERALAILDLPYEEWKLNRAQSRSA